MANRSRRSTKGDKGNIVNDLFSTLPLDLIVDILLKLPVKVIFRLRFVSKQLSSIIQGKYFTNLYITQSLTRPRQLFVYNKKNSLIFDSSSQLNQSSDRQKVKIRSYHMNSYDSSASIRGLICLQNNTRVMVGNPSTGQFVTLPKVNTIRRHLFSFFGYDPAKDEYKVLCLTVLQRRGARAISNEHQVFTLGPKQKWRKIECNHPHIPELESKGICSNGVVCYYGRVEEERSLICFDLTLEDFSVVKFPEDLQGLGLVNYHGKIALWSQLNTTLNLWVLQDVKKQEWSKVSLVAPSHQLKGFRGTLSNGMLIFIHGDSSRCYDHVESPMILSNFGFQTTIVSFL